MCRRVDALCPALAAAVLCSSRPIHSGQGAEVNEKQGLKLREPSIYQIHIQGSLDESWGDYFGGEVTSIEDEAGRLAVTTLRTPPMDQAALVGLISRLHGLGLPLLLVEHVCVEEDRSSVSHEPPT